MSVLVDKESRADERERIRMQDRDQEKRSKHWRDMHNLISSAPSFDGTQDIDFWMHEVELYLERCDVEDEKTMRNVLVGALKGTAREWLGSLSEGECNRNSYASIVRALRERFGKTYMQKIRAYEGMKQKSSESLQAYADRLKKAAYGIDRTTTELVHKFYSTITCSSAVYDYVINLPCNSLQKAVEYVEQHSKGGNSSAPTKTVMTCSYCKRKGHSAANCRKKAKDASGKQRAKKLDNVEIEQQHVADSDSECSVDEAESDDDDVEHPNIECVQ